MHFHPEKTENKMVLFLTLGVSVLLWIAKTITGILSGSAAMISSAIDSLGDIVSTLINIFVLHHAQKPADEDHTYGHGKFEAFASLIQAFFILVLSGGLFVYTIAHFGKPLVLDYSIAGILVILVSIIAPIILSHIIKKFQKNSASLVLEAEHEHFFADGVMNLGVLISLVIFYYAQIPWIDSLIGIAIGIFLVTRAVKLLKKSFDVLTDRELPEEIQNKIKGILDHSTEITGWHCLRTRQSGSEYHMDVHLEFSCQMTLKEVHHRSHLLEDKIHAAFPNMVILTHFDYRDDR